MIIFFISIRYFFSIVDFDFNNISTNLLSFINFSLTSNHLIDTLILLILFIFLIALQIFIKLIFIVNFYYQFLVIIQNLNQIYSLILFKHLSISFKTLNIFDYKCLLLFTFLLLYFCSWILFNHIFFDSFLLCSIILTLTALIFNYLVLVLLFFACYIAKGHFNLYFKAVSLTHLS